MADQYDNTNRGSLFKNERKEQPTHADLNGRINVEGVEYYLNAWMKESPKTGKKFYSLSVKPVDAAARPAPARQAQAAAPQRRAPAMAELDDEIPF